MLKLKWYQQQKRVYQKEVVVTLKNQGDSPHSDVVTPPRSYAVENDKSAPQLNRNIVEIEKNGRMQWQKSREYVRRNYSELGVQRYQRTFGNAMHAWSTTRSHDCQWCAQ